MQPEEARRLEQQVRVSKMLADGFMFSIVWLGGIGSLIAFIKGWRAMKIIRQSNGELAGTAMAWWCRRPALRKRKTLPSRSDSVKLDLIVAGRIDAAPADCIYTRGYCWPIHLRKAL